MVAALLAAGMSGVVPTRGPALSRAAAAPTATGFGSNWTVYHRNAAGGGADPANTDLATVRPAWTSPGLDGQIYGEPLVEAGHIIVATENNTVYALAAGSGTVVWRTHIVAPVPSSDISNAGDCGTIGPTVGITSTPVIDPARNEVFVVADEHAGSHGASHHLVGLSLASGSEVLNKAVDPAGSSPLAQLQRPGLALDAGG